MRIAAAARAPNGAKSAETREKILRAAEALFIERGYDGVSINDVAERAETAKALVFYYFGCKRELFGAVLDGYYIAQAEALRGAVGAAGGARERIHAGLDAYMDFVEANPGYPRLIQGEICSGGENLGKIVEHMAPLERWGMMVFGGLLPDGGELTARQFFVTIFGMTAAYYTYNPVLKKIWKTDPMKKAALAERRAHVHAAVGALLDKFLAVEVCK